MMSQEKSLRVAFIAGAVTDALAIIPMLVPPIGTLMSGIDDSSAAYRFAVGSAASLMLGWACQNPVERRCVAAFTVVVICGLVITAIVGVMASLVGWPWMLPAWCLQAVLLALFAGASSHRRGKGLDVSNARGKQWIAPAP